MAFHLPSIHYITKLNALIFDSTHNCMLSHCIQIYTFFHVGLLRLAVCEIHGGSSQPFWTRSYVPERNRERKTAHHSTHRAGDINAEYHQGALVALATGGSSCRSRTDHVSNIWLRGNLFSKDVNDVPLTAELAHPDLHKNVQAASPQSMKPSFIIHNFNKY